MKTTETPADQAIIEKIKERAAAKWGKKWIAALVREYCRIANDRGDETATPIRRRPQIEGILNGKGCNLKTATMLLEAVGCRIKLVCYEIKVIEEELI